MNGDDELIIEQPQGGNWLAPGKRVGHLIGIWNVRSIEKVYDQLAERERDLAEFDWVDLDGEREIMSGADNHPGITNRLKAGNPAVRLGRITAVPSRSPGQKDSLVLGEHTPEDSDAFRAWWNAQKNGQAQKPASQVPAAQPVAQAQSQPVQYQTVAPPQPQPQPVSQPQLPEPAPEVDLSKLDPATLALLVKAVNQGQGQ